MIALFGSCFMNTVEQSRKYNLRPENCPREIRRVHCLLIRDAEYARCRVDDIAGDDGERSSLV